VNTLSKVHAVGLVGEQENEIASPRKGLPKAKVPTKKSDFSSFYHMHWEGLCAFLRKTFGSGPPDPEDVAQDAFYQLAKMKSREHIENPKAFLYKISINLTLRSLKSDRWIANVVPGNDESFESELLSLSEPDKILHSQQALQQLGALFCTLSEKQKYIVSASRLEGKTYQQISDDTGWSIADVCRQLNSALVILASSVDAND
jgi:RNA polymerase sigma-70 factor (ECF subfamily)